MKSILSVMRMLVESLLSTEYVGVTLTHQMSSRGLMSSGRDQ